MNSKGVSLGPNEMSARKDRVKLDYKKTEIIFINHNLIRIKYPGG